MRVGFVPTLTIYFYQKKEVLTRAAASSYWSSNASKGRFIMQNLIFRTIPVLVTVIIAIRTYSVRLALFCGICVAGLVATDFSLSKAALYILQKIYVSTGISEFLGANKFLDNSFLVFLMFMFASAFFFEIIKKSNAIEDYAKNFNRYPFSLIFSKIYFFIIASFMFIDEELNVLISHMMAPQLLHLQVNNQQKKIRDLIMTYSSSICSLIPISSSCLSMVMFLEASGINRDGSGVLKAAPFPIFLRSIPFFYLPIFCVIFLFIRVFKREHISDLQHDVEILSEEKNGFADHRSRTFLFSLFGPLLSAPVFSLIIMMATAKYFPYLSKLSFLEAVDDINIEEGLFFGTFLAGVLSFLFFTYKHKFRLPSIFGIFKASLDKVGPAALTIVFCWTFATIISKDLKLSEELMEHVFPMINNSFLPLFIFLLVATVGVLMGSAWATLALATPMITNVLPSQLVCNDPLVQVQWQMIYPVIGAIFSGSFVSLLFSPMSDLLGTCAEKFEQNPADLLSEFVKSNTPAIVATIIAFLFAGFFHSAGNFNPVLPMFVGFLFGFVFSLKTKHVV